MHEYKERPARARDDLLDVNDVADRLLKSRATVYRYARRGILPAYWLPGGVRFKVEDVDVFLDNRRTDALSIKRYGSTQGKG